MNQDKIEIYIHETIALIIPSKSIKAKVMPLLQYILSLCETYTDAIGEELKEVEERIDKVKLQIKDIINGKK